MTPFTNYLDEKAARRPSDQSHRSIYVTAPRFVTKKALTLVIRVYVTIKLETALHCASRAGGDDLGPSSFWES